MAMHLMVLSLRRTVFFLFACPGMMKVLAMYLPISYQTTNATVEQAWPNGPMVKHCARTGHEERSGGRTRGRGKCGRNFQLWPLGMHQFHTKRLLPTTRVFHHFPDILPAFSHEQYTACEPNNARAPGLTISGSSTVFCLARQYCCPTKGVVTTITYRPILARPITAQQARP